ncbi:hypothetical protein AVEN_166516-1 [Araneus ventricosus]|uniref:Uncharacterized protein n=1 Tax=Araneus ventricosus TaxID=182803 RepID=A0A4Y2IRS9_ARAVE|nr:hypothetical protein AVEN_166516-1 [Araneus ventricosus]
MFESNGSILVSPVGLGDVTFPPVNPREKATSPNLTGNTKIDPQGFIHSPTFENVNGCDIFKRLPCSSISSDSEDSEISEDINESPEDTQCFFKAKHTRAMNKNYEIELPVGSRNRKKRKLEDGVPGSSTMLTSQEFSERISSLQQLMEEEKELKIAIAYEKLRKEKPALLDTDILHKKIAEYRSLLQEARNEHKMKNIMCVNLQLANTLQRIVRKPKAASTKKGFSDSQRKCIEDLLKKKKELSRSITIKRKEIAKTDEDVLKLERTVSTNKGLGRGVNQTRSTSTKMDNLEEVERLEENSKKVAERVQFLSHIIQSLIPHTGRQEDSDLSELMEECEKVSRCQLDNLDDINALLTGVRSVKL